MQDKAARKGAYRGFLMSLFLIPALVFQSMGPVHPIRTRAADTRTLYVAENGNDSTGNGSPDNPYRSIKKAAEQATAGTTVLIRPGTYIEDDIRNACTGGGCDRSRGLQCAVRH
ncbi:MAG: DUF1565 domain-containing protein [Oscillospiraceae bacterium]|nr:DUF1565 domain-containing protein [Oscillospiraceae bacterium]